MKLPISDEKSPFTITRGKHQSKIPEDYARFSPGESSVAKQFHDLARISVRATQHSGLFMFRINKENCSFTFSWLSIPTFAAFMRLLTLAGMMVYYEFYKSLIEQRFQSASASGNYGTLGATERILSGTIFLSDGVGILLLWRNRKEMEEFLNKLSKTITQNAEELINRSWITDWFCKASKRAKWLVTTISATSGIITLIIIYQNLHNMMLSILGKSELDWFGWSFPIFAFCWFTVLFRRLHFRVLIMSTIDILQFGFKTVRKHVQELGNEIVNNNNSSKKIRSYLQEEKLNQIVEKYRGMEALVGEFNEIFNFHMLIGIGSLLIVILISLFHFLVEITAGVRSFIIVLIFISEAAINMWVLHGLGTSATDLADQIMLQFQQALAVPIVISPGNFFSLNRQMITSIAGTLTTYLIVLIQFRNNESASLQNNSTNHYK
ncbi:unnamed protein product [Orchesella dallaii]|uniref:Gustatory receptor n=1 Tax=Orchesella dallaii TaxID=48710 RepID=A0ABP1R489_9HEXA